jgi:hypothetical protein
MKTLFTLIFLFASIFLLSAESEKEPEDKKAPLTFDIDIKFPLKVKHSYRFDEETNVKRIYEDGSTYEYERTYTYWVTLWAPAKPDDGVQPVWVIVDSLEYYFKDDNYEASYYNLQDEAPPTHRPDFNRTFIPNGLEFNMYYDDYGVVGKVEGGTLQEQIDYINHPEYGFRNNDYGLQLFTNRYSLQDLKHIADPSKGVLPPFPVAKDSSWNVDFTFDINFATFGGITKPKFTMIADNSYFIEMKMDSLTLIDDYYDLHDKKVLAEIDSSRADGTFEMKIQNPGHVQYIQTKQDAWLDGKAKNMRFRDSIKTTQKWELLGMWYL